MRLLAKLLPMNDTATADVVGHCLYVLVWPFALMACESISASFGLVAGPHRRSCALVGGRPDPVLGGPTESQKQDRCC